MLVSVIAFGVIIGLKNQQSQKSLVLILNKCRHLHFNLSLSLLSLITPSHAFIRKQNTEKLWVIRASGHICYIIFHSARHVKKDTPRKVALSPFRHCLHHRGVFYHQWVGNEFFSTKVLYCCERENIWCSAVSIYWHLCVQNGFFLYWLAYWDSFFLQYNSSGSCLYKCSCLGAMGIVLNNVMMLFLPRIALIIIFWLIWHVMKMSCLWLSCLELGFKLTSYMCLVPVTMGLNLLRMPILCSSPNRSEVESTRINLLWKFKEPFL